MYFSASRSLKSHAEWVTEIHRPLAAVMPDSSTAHRPRRRDHCTSAAAWHPRADDTVITHSRAILSWVRAQRPAATRNGQPV
jgi:hypothetical protein